MMKRIAVFLILFSLFCPQAQAAMEEGEGPYGEESQSGWSLGTDQGVQWFVGNSSRFINAQYYGAVYGGYNFGGYIMPMIRMAQSFGSLNGFGNPSTFWFILEGGFRATPVRYKIRPYFVGTAGFYYLSFTNLGSPVQGGSNFTFNGGGGLEVALGRSALTVGGAYRGFTNPGLYLQGVEVTLGYRFQF